MSQEEIIQLLFCDNQFIREWKLQLFVFIVSVAGPPDTEDPFDGNRDDPVFMDTNEGASSSQDSDQSSSKYHEIHYVKESRQM